MKKWWTGFALWMGTVGPAMAQAPMPGAFGGPPSQPMSPGAFGGPPMMAPMPPPGAFGGPMGPGAFGGAPVGPGAFGAPMPPPGAYGGYMPQQMQPVGLFGGRQNLAPGEPTPQPGPYAPPAAGPGLQKAFNMSPDPNKPPPGVDTKDKAVGKHGLLKKWLHKEPGELPKGDISLPCDGSPNAFECLEMCHDEGYYFHLGVMALWRQRLGHSTLVVQDPVAPTPTTNTDDGSRRPGPGAPELLNLNDIRPNANIGPRATIGYRYDTTAVELTGWYLYQNHSWALVADRARLDLPFASLPFGNNFPLGFGGNDNLWLQADVVRESLRTRMGSVEANYRWCAGAGAEWILGLRYLYHSETFEVLTEDERIPPNTFDPLRAATYSVRAESHIFGPQLGFELEIPILKGGLALGSFAKGVWGVNFNELVGRLERGDGFTAPLQKNSSTLFSHFYESGVFLDVMLLDQVRLRAGYQSLLLAHVPEVQAQINFDLSSSLLNPAPNYTGSIFYHGPFLELQIAF